MFFNSIVLLLDVLSKTNPPDSITACFGISLGLLVLLLGIIAAIIYEGGVGCGLMIFGLILMAVLAHGGICWIRNFPIKSI